MLLSEEATQVPWGFIWGVFAAFWVVVLVALFIFVPMMAKPKKTDAHH